MPSVTRATPRSPTASVPAPMIRRRGADDDAVDQPGAEQRGDHLAPPSTSRLRTPLVRSRRSARLQIDAPSTVPEHADARAQLRRARGRLARPLGGLQHGGRDDRRRRRPHRRTAALRTACAASSRAPPAAARLRHEPNVEPAVVAQHRRRPRPCTASHAARRACDSARSSSPLIHFESPPPVAIRPSRVWAYLSDDVRAAGRGLDGRRAGRRPSAGDAGARQLRARRVAVAEPALLGAQVADVAACAAVRSGSDALDGDPGGPEAVHLVRIVGQQPHRAHAQFRSTWAASA